MNTPIAIVTGGAEGIGRAIAQDLMQDHTVYIFDVQQERVVATAKELGCYGVVCDIANPESVKLAVDAVIAEAGGVDVLVNNAGVWLQGALEQNTAEQIARTVQVNVLGIMLVTHEVLPHIKQRGAGTIVNMSSQNGLHAAADRSVYNATKWAVTGFTKCLQEELHHQGVRVMGVYPAMVQTKIFANAGVDRDVTQGILPTDVADIVGKAIRAGSRITYPEIGIQPGGY